MPRLSEDQLEDRIEEAKKQVKIGSRYFHYKHPEQYYTIEFVGCWENTDEICVGYRAQYGKKILFVRLLTDFLEEVEVDGRRVKRFVWVADSV